MTKDPQFDRVVVGALASYLSDRVSDADRVGSKVEARVTGAMRGQSCGSGRTRNWRRNATFCLAGFVIAAGGLTAAAAASTKVRNAVNQPLLGLGISIGSGGIESTSPAGAFRVVNPRYMPQGLTKREFTYIPGHDPSSRATRTVSLYSIGMSQTPPPGFEIVFKEGVPAVYERFTSPGDGARYVEIMERAVAPGRPLPPGQSVTVGGVNGTLHMEGSAAVLELDRRGTHVTVRTDLGAAQAIRVAESLR